MRLAARKTLHELQLDLPLDESRPDPSSSLPLTPASHLEAIGPGAENSVTAPDAGQLARPVSFPIEPEPVVATHPEQAPRETKLPAGIDTDPNRNLDHYFGSSDTTGPGGFHAPGVSRTLTDSSTGIDQDAATPDHQISMSGWLRLLPLLRELRHAAEKGCPINDGGGDQRHEHDRDDHAGEAHHHE